MKIAVISDIHGNLEALKAVIQNAKDENCTAVYCLGDLAFIGPQPNETIEAVKMLAKDFTLELIQGNTDLMVITNDEETLERLRAMNPIMQAALNDDRKIITEENKKFLLSLPETKEIDLKGIKILLVHGSPRKQDENILPNLPIEEVEEMVKNTTAQIILCGHTHIPCGYQTNTRQSIVNVGSVGRSFNEVPKACYAVLEYSGHGVFSVKHNYVKYNLEKSAELLKKRNFNGAEILAQMLIKAISKFPA